MFGGSVVQAVVFLAGEALSGFAKWRGRAPLGGAGG